jgi:16S rRNA (guanine527-N7)-methyltransferase
MTEDEAQAWLRDEYCVSPEDMERLDQLRRIVIAESEQQNLISAATIEHFWTRHIVDSVQLIPFAARAKPESGWLDLGTGAGFPGLVVAILREAPITFVESRRKRSDFLEGAAEKLSLPHVKVHNGRLETMPDAAFGVISARAFAPLHRLLPVAHRFSRKKTIWLLPKGRAAREEMNSIFGVWQGMFHVEQSITESDAAIIVARGVAKKART